jgi:CheY-like chemotaxis protein
MGRSAGNLNSATKEVLCVDDDANTLNVRKLVLEASGYKVHLANSGENAISILANGQDVDLVLLDYLMPPGMNGDELASQLRRKYPELPLIAISAVGQLPATLLEAVDAHLQKGQDPEVLLATISAVLEPTER